MREITRSEHEMIFNLFIALFMGWYIPRTDYQYKALIADDPFTLFYKVKDFFPMDEICEDVYTPSGLERMNFIKDV